jgi:hypothetical protein
MKYFQKFIMSSVILLTFAGVLILPFYDPIVAVYLLAFPAGFGARVAYEFLMGNIIWRNEK